MHVTKQVCVQRRQSAESVALPAFAAAPPAVQQSIDIPCAPGPQQQTRRTTCRSRRMGQTDGRTPHRYIDPASHSLRVVPTTDGVAKCAGE